MTPERMAWTCPQGQLTRVNCIKAEMVEITSASLFLFPVMKLRCFGTGVEVMVVTWECQVGLDDMMRSGELVAKCDDPVRVGNFDVLLCPRALSMFVALRNS